MTLTLTPDTEARLRSVAELRGQDPENAIIALLTQALTEAETEAELLMEFRTSVADHVAGRSMTIKECREKALARRQERDEDHAATSIGTVFGKRDEEKATGQAYAGHSR